MLDSFRVFVTSDNGVTWSPLVTNNSVRSSTGTADAELPTFLSATGGDYHQDKANQRVQEAFDEPGLPSTNPHGYALNDFDQPLPTTAVDWRQARVDLGDFAGKSNLRLRFDFSTAGTMGQGLAGDQFGKFTTPYHYEQSTESPGIFFFVVDDMTGRVRGKNNDHEGVYIDDLVVGFAGRGEMVSGTFNPLDQLALNAVTPIPPITGNTLFSPIPQDTTAGARRASPPAPTNWIFAAARNTPRPWVTARPSR